MTRKDYELIASVLADLNADFNNGGDDTISLQLVATELAETLAAENPRFDRERFLIAAGVWAKCDNCGEEFTVQGWAEEEEGEGEE